MRSTLIKVNVSLLFLINAFYVFRGALVRFGLGSFIYILSFLSIIVSLLLLNTKEQRKISKIPFIFIAFGVLVLLFNCVFANAIGSLLGFIAFFFNVIIVFLFFGSLSTDEINKKMQLFVISNIVFGVVLGFFGIYQYYYDSSLFGFATHLVYGDIDLMASGRTVRRVTSFMGSPQNYAIFMSLSLLLCISTNRFKLFPKIILSVFLFYAGMVSGSRAFTLSTLFGLFVYGSLLLKDKKGLSGLFISYILLFVGGIALLFVLQSFSFTNATFERLFTFLNDEPVFAIIDRNLRTVDVFSFLFGKGLGNGERLAYEFLGPSYLSIYGSSYESYESYFLSIFMQCGVLGLFLIVIMLFASIKHYYDIKHFGGISTVVAIFVNMIFTPSFTGLAMSFISSFIILYPLCVSGQKTKILVCKCLPAGVCHESIK